MFSIKITLDSSNAFRRVITVSPQRIPFEKQNFIQTTHYYNIVS